ASLDEQMNAIEKERDFYKQLRALLSQNSATAASFLAGYVSRSLASGEAPPLSSVKPTTDQTPQQSLVERAVALLGEGEADLEYVRSLPGVSGGETAGRYFLQIKRFFETINNEWATAKQIAEGAGISDDAVTHVVYKTHKVLFSKRKRPGFSHGNEWKLNPE